MTPRSFVPGVLVLLAVACRAAGPAPYGFANESELGEIQQELIQVGDDLESDRGFTFVDIHAHHFNALCLPLSGIATARAGGILGNDRPRELAQTLVALTRARVVAAASDPPRPVTAGDIRAYFCPEGGAENHRHSTATKEVTRILDPEPTVRTDLGTLQRDLGALGFVLEIPRIQSFVERMTSPMGRNVEEYFRAFDGMPEFVISHAMDMGPSYAQGPSPGQLLDFRREQLPLYHELTVEKRIGFFVGYNPFREDHLEIVSDAIQHPPPGGAPALGVKVYPPDGYRPAGNDRRPPKPGMCWLLGSKRCDQWEAKYGQLAPGELDGKLQELLLWCEENDVPVFAHCGQDEFQAQAGFGKLMADPQYWKRYLDDHPCPNRETGCQLRLCLGHAGGIEYWIGEQDGWGETVHELCTDYEHVYCGFGVLDEVSDVEVAARFVHNMERLIRESVGANEADPSSFLLHEKIVFGTDWFMPIRVSPREYVKAYRIAFGHELLADYADSFFRENANRFLKR